MKLWSETLPLEKKMCIEMNTTSTARKKLMLSLSPNMMAESIAVATVARVLEYFFSIVSAYLHEASELRMELCVQH